MPAIKSNLPTAPEDTTWDSGEAIKAVKAWASDSDGNIDFAKYKKAFFYMDDGGGDKQGDYHLPFADVISGELKAVWNGVAAAMAALNGARGSGIVPDGDKEAVYAQIGKYYDKFGKDQPELSKALIRDVGERVDVIMNIDQTTVKDLGDGVFSATVTTSDVDRMGESIDTEGISTETYMQNPVVLYGHDYQGLPIGKATKLRQFKNKLSATFQLAVKEYSFAQTVADMIKGGYLNAVSIGGVVKEWSDDYSQILGMEMVEFSVVPVPANPAALITARSFEKATGKSVEQVASEYHDFVEKSYADRLKGLDNIKLERHIESLKDLTAILETTLAAKKSEKDISDEDDEKIILTLRKTAGKVSDTGQQIIRLVKATKG